jgi:hypothetical protein
MTGRRTRALRLLTLTLVTSLSAAATASGAQSAKLTVTLTPEHLGIGTTISFAFKIITPNSRVPSPLSSLDFRYPAKVGLLTSGLGLTSCTPTILEEIGPEGCPANSLMGHGSAVVEIPIGPEIIHETGHITIWMGPVTDGHVGLLFYAEGNTPLSSELIFPGTILEARPPYGGDLYTIIPAIPILPEAPNAAVVQMHATIGPKNLTYYRHTSGKKTPYKPEGLRLPHSCPHGGFPFAATFTFQDGTHTTAHATVTCPTHR